MRIRIVLLLTLLIAGLTFAQTTAVRPVRPLVFTHVTVIDVTGTPSKSDMTVMVAGNHIAAVGRTGKVRIPKNAQVVDASGKFLIPGLWDMHAHALSHIDSSYEWFFPMLIANGVTGVRVPGNNLAFEKLNQLRKEVTEERLLGPRLGAITGRILDGPGSIISHVSTVVTTPEEGRQLVRTYKQQGADFIKPYDRLSREVYLAIVDEAKQQRIAVAGHVPLSMSAAEVSDLGQITIEHILTDIFISCSREEGQLRRDLQEWIKTRQRGGLGAVLEKAVATYDDQKAQSFFVRLRRNGTWLCPTIVVTRPEELVSDESKLLSDSRMKYIPTPSRERWHTAFQQRNAQLATLAQRKSRYDLRLKIIGAMHRAGLLLLAGSDAPNPYVFPGFSLQEELELLVEAGLSPLAALQTATVNPAKFLGKEKELGTIEKGKLADLVLLEANPLESIGNTRRINAVVVNGRYLPQETLQKLLADVEAFANGVKPR